METTGTIEPRLNAINRETLELLADGLTAADMAKTVSVSLHTMKSRIQRLYQVLGADNRAHAVRLGFDQGILTSAQSAEVDRLRLALVEQEEATAELRGRLDRALAELARLTADEGWPSVSQGRL